MIYGGERTIGGILSARAADSPEREIVRFEDSSIGYAELDRRADRLAAGLQRLGIGKGDTVAVQLPNSEPALVAWFGLARAGAVEVPLNTGLRGDLLAHALRRTGCRLAIVAAEWADRFRTAAAGLDRAPRLVLVGPEAHPGPGDLTWEELVAGTEPPLAVAVAPEDVAVVIFTSGTTGPSKGVALSHNANFETARTMVSVCEYGPRERLFTAFPMHHTNARYASILVAMLLEEGSAVLHRRFSASRFWEICRAERVSAFNFMGALLLMLQKQPARAEDREHLVRKAWGAPAPAELVPEFERRFGVTLLEGYGSTETGIATSNRIGQRRLGSCGRAIPEYEIELHVERDREVPVGEVGEFCVRGRRPHVLLESYFGEPEATVEATRNLWFHTGDRGRVDADGWFHFVDRSKDAIRRRGENISSWEVQSVLDSHPAVAESAVIGVPSELSEEEVLCAVVLKPGRALEPAELLDFAQPRLPHFAVPRYVRFLPELPKNEQQKVQKFVLRERADVLGQAWDREAAGYVVER